MTGITLHETQSDLPSPNPTPSYWHREPRLQRHRTTPELPARADVVVVGAGITGAFAARFLAERGREVVMLEAREVGWGATGRNGGHCQPSLYASKPHVAAFELRNYAFLRDLVSANHIPCDWVSAPGVHALHSAPLVSAAASNIAALRRQDPALGRAVRLATDAPTLARLRVPRAEGAVVQENAAALWPYRLVVWVLEDLLLLLPSARHGRRRLLNLQTGTPVVDVQRHGASWIVHTPRGQVAAAQVLVACNGYTSRVLPRFAGVVVPVRGQVAALTPAWRLGSPLGGSYGFAGPVGGAGGGASVDDYLIQAGGGARELVYGGGRALGDGKGWGVSSDEEVDPRVSSHLRRNLGAVLDSQPPAEEEHDDGGEMPASYEWTGIMGFSADAYPWVGRVPERLGGGDGGMFVCGGYTGHGMPVAALSAKAVVAMMCGEGEGEGEEMDLPEEFGVTEERVERVLAGERLRVEDYEGLLSCV